jgi:hypothetical protein
VKPAKRSGYPLGQHGILRASCLELARVLPLPIADHVTLIGGAVPSLRVPPVPGDPHPGTLDLDLGLELGIGDPTLLTKIEAQLTQAGFGPGVDKAGHETRDTWRYPNDAVAPKITLDLIAGGPSSWLPEIRFAFQDRDRLSISGQDFGGRDSTGELWVCGIASFVLLKGLAFRRRQEPKDAFDLYWCLRHWPNVWNELQQRMAIFMRDDRAREILGYLTDDFEEEGPGAEAAARFAAGTSEDQVRADATGLVGRMLTIVGFS